MTRHITCVLAVAGTLLTGSSANGQAPATISFDSDCPRVNATDAWYARGSFKVATGWTANSVVCYATPISASDPARIRKRYKTSTFTLDPANGIWDAGGNGLPNGSYDVWVELSIAHATLGSKKNHWGLARSQRDNEHGSAGDLYRPGQYYFLRTLRWGI